MHPDCIHLDDHTYAQHSAKTDAVLHTKLHTRHKFGPPHQSMLARRICWNDHMTASTAGLVPSEAASGDESLSQKA